MGGRTLDQFRSQQRAKAKGSPAARQAPKDTDTHQPNHNKSTQHPEEE